MNPPRLIEFRMFPARWPFRMDGHALTKLGPCLALDVTAGMQRRFQPTDLVEEDPSNPAPAEPGMPWGEIDPLAAFDAAVAMQDTSGYSEDVPAGSPPVLSSV